MGVLTYPFPEDTMTTRCDSSLAPATSLQPAVAYPRRLRQVPDTALFVPRPARAQRRWAWRLGRAATDLAVLLLALVLGLRPLA
jgi:hypothetical protein